MTKKAIRMGAKYVLYWDDDTLPPRMALYTLHNWLERHPEVGAISAVYTTREDPPEPLIYTEHGAGAAWDFPMGPGAEPVPIFGCGAGFLLARVQAITETIERMKQENGGVEQPIWADERTVPDPKERSSHRIMWGHDIRFCKILQETGWPVYVHGGVLCEHLDIPTGRIFAVPVDAPGFRLQMSKNINTANYWDIIYTTEGADTHRKYPEMFERITGMIDRGSKIVELGCGVGILGSRLTAQKQVQYVGYDISPVAVEMAKTRFLDAHVLDVRELDVNHLDGASVVVATELVEHLDRDVFDYVMNTIDYSKTGKFIFTVPNKCMGPEEEPEHVALFDANLVRKYVKSWASRWSLRILKADKYRLLCIMERGKGEAPARKKEDRKSDAGIQTRHPKKLVRSARKQPKASGSNRVKRSRSIPKVEEKVYVPK